MTPTGLRDSHQVWHVVKVIGREIGITSRLDLLQSPVDLGTEFLLEIAVFGHFPECKGQLERGEDEVPKITLRTKFQPLSLWCRALPARLSYRQ